MRSIRWKLILTIMAAVFIPVFFLHQHFVTFFDLFTRTSLENHMREQAMLVGDIYRSLYLEESDESERAHRLSALLQDYNPHARTRLQVLNDFGVVLLDTADVQSVGADLFHLPEIKGALRGEYSARSSLTPDRRLMYYFCAEPIRHDGRVIGVVYVSRNTNPIIQAIKFMLVRQRFALALSLALAAASAFVFAQTITLRLRRLTRAAGAYADGDTAVRAEVYGRDEVAELARAFNHLAEQLEKREDYNREFISATMHELKAPLTAIKGAAELLEQGAAEKPEARDKFLANIRYEADRLARLVSELTELSRLDIETLRGEREEVDYVDTVRQIVDRLVPAFETPRADLKVQLPEEPIPVSIIPARIEQVIANLLENAFRYTPPGGTVEVKVEPGPEGYVSTSVSDTGPGISEANLTKVFDRFFTTEPKGETRVYGSGLGLAIAKSIIENHRGTIAVLNPAGQGAVFRYQLPRVISS